ncbi:MAG TPA: acyl-CoA synthetase [Burkholderiaceae bacterium]|nr:acyl-CoA synthetase [Burkholderiaceae bacterium]
MSAVHPPPPAEAQPWAATPERSTMLALRVIVWIALKLGRRAARLVLLPITLYFTLFAPRARRASRRYLTRALGRRATWRDSMRHFHTFAATILDRVFFLNDRADLFELDVQGAATAIEHAPQGALLFGAHFGSFEAVRAIGRMRSGMRVSVVMYEDNARKTNEVLAAINPRVCEDILPLGRLESMLALKRRLDEGGYVGVLADRTLGEETMRDVTLLGARAQLPVGPFRLAALLRRPVIFMTGVYLGGNRYSIRFDAIADFSHLGPGERAAAVHHAMDRYAAKLDALCREAPFNWFNFFPFWVDDVDACVAAARARDAS